MIEAIEKAASLPIVIALLVTILTTFATFAFWRNKRDQQLKARAADLEFLALLNDRKMFCDTSEQFKNQLERIVSEPLQAVAENPFEESEHP